MNAFVADLMGRSAGYTRAEQFIFNNIFDRPTLVVDLDSVEQQYLALEKGLGQATMHYAVKANPHMGILRRLVALGSGFDAASRAEIEMCLEAGAAPEKISFGNTIKKVSDIAFAFAQGINLFAADAEEELDKLSEAAPGAQVFIRVIVDNPEADWPLSRKFGCAPAKVLSLLAYAQAVGLKPVGLSFHVGSQTRQARMWEQTLDQVAGVWHEANRLGYDLQLLNIGGGFPAFHGEEIEGPVDYARNVVAKVTERFGEITQLMAEPGRGMVAEAGAIAAEVLLVSRKSDDDLHRWVYLDIGKFSGLAETEGEAIRYQFITNRDTEEFGPCVLAGPSCDSADVLYENRPVSLPIGLKSGDRIIIRTCGAYTSTYASVGFNGFPPLDVVVI